MRRPQFVAILTLAFLAACQSDGTAPVRDSDLLDSAQRASDIRTGYVLGLRGEIVKVAYEVRGGMAIIEGDIVIGPADSIASSAEQLQKLQQLRRGVYVDATDTNRWPNGVVHYLIDASLTSPQPVLDAITHVKQNVPGVGFVSISEAQANTMAHVRFVPSEKDCESYIGRQGGRQEIWVAPRCTTGDVVHEIGHALGVQHEHARCDREQYVEILWNNIIAEAFPNFDIRCVPYSDFGDYSEGSIMHYSPYAFSRNGQPTIRSRRGRESEMGQRARLNDWDVSTLSLLYRPQREIHRRYKSAGGGDHLYSPDLYEGSAQGYVLEDRDYFRLTLATGSHYGTLYRCYINNRHYLSRDLYCGVGIRAEGSLGRVARWQMGGTLPLYQTRDPVSGDRLATTNPVERTATLNSGWVDEGILGYVWPGS